MKKYIIILLMLFSLAIQAQWCEVVDPSFCPGNYFTNGDFESLNDNPNTKGDTDIDSANGWSAMWNANNTMADLACPGTSQSPGNIAIPIPNSGVYAGMWIAHNTSATGGNNRFREGMYNSLNTNILYNSGAYSFTFDIADGNHGWTQPVSVGIYGVFNPLNLIAPAPLTPNNPTNENLWSSTPTVQVIKLGSVLIDPNVITNTWSNYSISFNSNMTGFPTTGIDHIMITNDTDYRDNNSSVYLNFDRFCLQPSITCDDCCQTDLNLNHTKDKHVANVPNGAPWSQNVPLSITEELITISTTSLIPITEVRVTIQDFEFTNNNDTCATCINNPGHWASLGYRGTPNITTSTGGILKATTGNGYNPILGDQKNLRELVWENPNGVMLNMGDSFSFNFIFPSFSEIPCCATEVKVCFKITWKDANCILCEQEFCSEYELKQ